MKPKTKAFLDKLISDPKISQTDAYLETHATTNRATARAESSTSLAKPSSQIYLRKHIQKAKENIIEIANKSDKDETRLKASIEILDRSLGKSIQRTESQNTNLNINLEASKELADNFTAFLKQNTVL